MMHLTGELTTRVHRVLMRNVFISDVFVLYSELMYLCCAAGG
jgi:hypothetical protein